MSKIIVENAEDLFNIESANLIFNGETVEFMADIDLKLDTVFDTAHCASASGAVTATSNVLTYIRVEIVGGLTVGESYDVKEMGFMQVCNITCVQSIGDVTYCSLNSGSPWIEAGGYAIDGTDCTIQDRYEGWWPLSNSGTINGNGHKITGLYLNINTDNNGFVSSNMTGGYINDLHVTGNMSGGHYSGMICGRNWGNISKSSSSGNIAGKNDWQGGFIGVNNGLIENCYSTADVYGDYQYVGGFAGGNITDAIISNCYSTGLVEIVGTNKGGFCGYTPAIITNCFWNIETSGQLTSSRDLGTGLTTAQMQTVSTFTVAGWDFVADWRMDTLFGHPQQRIFDPVIAGRSSAAADRFDSLTDRFCTDYDRFGVFT